MLATYPFASLANFDSVFEVIVPGGYLVFVDYAGACPTSGVSGSPAALTLSQDGLSEECTWCYLGMRKMHQNLITWPSGWMPILPTLTCNH